MAKRHAPSKRYKNTSFLATLGKNCRRLRIQKGYSIDRMSREGDKLSPGAIHRLENGTADVHVSLLFRYADVLEVPVTKLFEISSSNIVEQAKENASVSLEVNSKLGGSEALKKFGDGDVAKKSIVIQFDSSKKKPKNAVPFYPLEIAAGKFAEGRLPGEPSGWVIVDSKHSSEDFFASRVKGSSMEPTIPDGSICLFKKYSGGSRQGKVLLVQVRGLVDPDTGSSFVLKRYKRITALNDADDRSNVIIQLLSDNREYDPIQLKGLSEEAISTLALFVKVLHS
jgi:transcriptional regulator with XRE-family HTH domain